MTRRCGSNGFRPGMTLLEVLLAIALAVVVLSGAYSLHAYVLAVQADLAEQSRRAGRERLVLDQLARDLRAASASQFLRLGMQGRPDRVQFVRAGEPSPATWLVPTADQVPPPPESDLRLVGYRLGVARDEQGVELRSEEGERIILGLERTCQKVLTAPNVEEGESFGDVQEIETVLLSPEVRFLHLRYYTGDAWVGRWGGGDLPRAVRVILGYRPLPEEMDVETYLMEYDTIQRVISLPAAEGAARRPGRPRRGVREGAR